MSATSKARRMAKRRNIRNLCNAAPIIPRVSKEQKIEKDREAILKTITELDVFIDEVRQFLDRAARDERFPQISALHAKTTERLNWMGEFVKELKPVFDTEDGFLEKGKHILSSDELMTIKMLEFDHRQADLISSIQSIAMVLDEEIEDAAVIVEPDTTDKTETDQTAV